MNTTQLKNFAQETRRKFLTQVEAKLEFVLHTDSSELREKAPIVDDLKKVLSRFGREALIDKVAYTWFNRFVALRYLDARGFQPLGISILTPHKEQVSPQLLQEAIAGHIPADLKVNQQQVMDILDGRTPSSNPENEVYRLLLVASCNHLNSTFPFLFEAINDYTELLLPDDLTSEFSIVQDLVTGMTTEDCQEVEILGWLYQFYISEKKDEVFASKSKVSKDEIPAATQLFTPRWIVEYMVQNTVGKLWLLNKPSSDLKKHMPYYIESEVTEEDVLKVDTPEELTLLDQACGSGHILVYGFELLYKIYEEEGYAPSEIPALIIDNNLHGFEIDERAAQLAGLAVLMKAREYHRSFFRKEEVPEPNITCFEDLLLSDEEIKSTLNNIGIKPSDALFHDLQNMQQATNFGSLIAPHSSIQEIQETKEKCKKALDKADLFEKDILEQLIVSLGTLGKLGTKVTCIADNPPYMGNGNMNKELSDFVKAHYPDSKSDLMACFIDAGLNGLTSKGVLGMINQQSWMFTSSYEKLRQRIIKNSFFDTLLHLGSRTFPEIGGEVVRNVAFTLMNNSIAKKGVYLRLVDYNNSELKRCKVIEAISNPNYSWFFKADQKGFKEMPGSPIGYWVGSKIIEAFQHELIGKNNDVKEGVGTRNDERFIRFSWEISLLEIGVSKKWVRTDKAGGALKWYNHYIHLMNWENDGYEIKNYRNPDGSLKSRPQNIQYLFTQAISWGKVSSGNSSFRYREDRFSFNDAAPSIFGPNLNYILGLLNSKVSKAIIGIKGDTMNLTVGILKEVPLLYENKSFIEKLVSECINYSKLYWNSSELVIDHEQSEFIRHYEAGGMETLKDAYEHYQQYWTNKFYHLHENEEELNQQFIGIYGLQDELTPEVPLNEITILQEELDANQLKKLDKVFRKQEAGLPKPALPFKSKEVFAQFVSYAVGCMFGRYSLDKEGLILANQGETLEDYLAKVASNKDEVSFLPDDDNIIPVLDDEWFEDDIVFRFNEFLKASFGEQNFQQNLSFVEEMLGCNLRTYFSRHFYKEHNQRYKKRPIYWKFNSPKKHFCVLIYMHRYTPDTLNNILNNYLREFVNKLKTSKEHAQHIENTGSASEKAQASKSIDKLNEMIADCQAYEREILYPLATERIEMDLDDGVLVNYNLFGQAVEEISGVNDKKKKAQVKKFDWIDGGRIR